MAYTLIQGSVISNIGQHLEGWTDVQTWTKLTIGGIIPNLIKLGLIVACVVLAVFLIWGGITWITAGGDKEKLSKAQKMLTAALIGIVIVFSTWAIIRLVQYFFGIHLISGGGTPGPGPGPGSTYDCSQLPPECPGMTDYTPAGNIPYCDFGGKNSNNSCKIKCCYLGDCNRTGSQAPWWHGYGINCYQP